MPTKYSKHMRRGGMQKAFSQGAAEEPERSLGTGNQNLFNLNPTNVKLLSNANVDSAFAQIFKKLSNKSINEYVYYILGPITQFDRALIKRLLAAKVNGQDIKVHVFIQGGIERFSKPDPPWATSLLGLVPANAGMDFENFYGFFEEDAHPNLHVYVQFTNMAKPLPPLNTILHGLWKEDNAVMKTFLDDLEENERGHLFAKLWAFYFRTSGGGPWQHDPIEVINSLGALVGEGNYYHKMVMSGRCVRYDKMHPDGVVFQNESTASIETNLNAYKPYVHSEAYDMSQLAVPYITKINAGILNRQKGVLGAINKVRGLPVQEGQFNNATNYTGGANGIDKNTIIAKLLDHIPPNKTKEQFDECQKYRFNQFIRLLRKSFGMNPAEPTKDDDPVDTMIEHFQSKYLAGISIEILDPDNLFAAELVKLISGGSPEIFCHHQFYPENVTINCRVVQPGEQPGITRPTPKVLSLMDIPKNVIDELIDGVEGKEPKLKDVRTTNPVSRFELINNGPKEYYNLGGFLGAIIPSSGFEPKELMYGQYYGEHTQQNVDCAEPELYFMFNLMKTKIMNGQMLYGNTPNCRTFSATNLLHPITQMRPSKFLMSKMRREDFVDFTIREIANTNALSTVRVDIREEWIKLTVSQKGLAPTRKKRYNGGYNKSRKIKSRKNKSRK